MCLSPAPALADNGAMTNQALVPAEIAARYEVHEWRNGLAILTAAHPEEWTNLLEVLRDFVLLKSDVLKPGGSKGLISQRLDSHFTKLGWIEKAFDTRIVVDKSEFVTPTHKVDCYKNRVALEVEWNNKDPFYDRDLNNFRLLFDLRAIDAGVIITRCTELQQIFNQLGAILDELETKLARRLTRNRRQQTRLWLVC